MKRVYFEEGVVDGDDVDHKAAVEQGIVPPKCLVGGATIWHAHARSMDICGICPWDRTKCGGRPQQTKLITQSNSELVNMGSVGALQDVRSRQMLELDKLADEVETGRKRKGG